VWDGLHDSFFVNRTTQMIARLATTRKQVLQEISCVRMLDRSTVQLYIEGSVVERVCKNMKRGSFRRLVVALVVGAVAGALGGAALGWWLAPYMIEVVRWLTS
jgi:hypothetical protein